MNTFETTSAFETYLDRYDEIKLIHSTEKGTVYLVENITTKNKYISKVMLKANTNIEVYCLLDTIKETAIPKIIDIFVDDENIIVIEEFIEGRNLKSYIDENVTFPKKKIINIFVQLCKILKNIHNANIIHRDIKPSNILLSEDGKVSLIDFDASRIVKGTHKSEDTIKLGTKGYAPPEQYGFAETDQRSDIYALGMTIKELLGNRYRRSYINKIVKKSIEVDAENRYSNINSLIFSLHIMKYEKVFNVFLTSFLYVLVFISTAVTANENSSLDISNFNVKNSDDTVLAQTDYIQKGGLSNSFVYENPSYGDSIFLPFYYKKDEEKSSYNTAHFSANRNDHLYRLAIMSNEAPDAYNYTKEKILDTLKETAGGKELESIFDNSRVIYTAEVNNDKQHYIISYVTIYSPDTELKDNICLVSNDSFKNHKKELNYLLSSFISPQLEVQGNSSIEPTISISDIENMVNREFGTIRYFINYLTDNNLSVKIDKIINSEKEQTAKLYIFSDFEPDIKFYVYLTNEYKNNEIVWKVRNVNKI